MPRLGLLAALLGWVALASAGPIRKMAFDAVESEPGQKLVLFVSDAPDTKALISSLKEVADFGKSFEYIYVACDDPESKEKCADAGFNSFPRYFSNSAEGGIETIGSTGAPPSKQELLDHLAFRTKPVENSKVIEFESVQQLAALSAEQPVVVKFHQTWCGHCKRLTKHFAMASTHASVQHKAAFVDVDCTKHKTFCSAESVSSYPTLKIWRAAGTEVSKDPKVPRTHKELASFMVQVADGSHTLAKVDHRDPAAASSPSDTVSEPPAAAAAQSSASKIEQKLDKLATDLAQQRDSSKLEAKLDQVVAELAELKEVVKKIARIAEDAAKASPAHREL